jgi:hypothetical protein
MIQLQNPMHTGNLQAEVLEQSTNEMDNNRDGYEFCIPLFMVHGLTNLFCEHIGWSTVHHLKEVISFLSAVCCI